MGIGKTYDPDRDLFWAPKAFFSWENGFEGRDDVRVRVLNFRGKTGTRREKAPGTIRILTVGGSNVYGDGIADNEHTFSGRLEQLLRARGVKAEVLNGGVRGYNSTQLMVLLRKYALSYHPDIVILYLMRNDIYVDKARYTYRELWLAGNEPWTRLRRQLQRSYLYDAMTSVILDARENMRTQWYDPGLWKDANPPQDFAANLRDMINDAQHAGAKVIAVSEFWGDRIPHEFHNERMEKFRATMEQAARRMGVPYYDAYDHFMAAPDPWIWVFPKDRTHFNYEGHAEMARYLENILIQNKLIPAGD